MTEQKRKPRRRVKRGPVGLSDAERAAQTSFLFNPKQAHRLVAEALITNHPKTQGTTRSTMTRPERRRTKRKSGSNGAAEPVTPKHYGAFQQAWDSLGDDLFDQHQPLPQVMLTLRKHANSQGFYAHNRFAGRIAATQVSEVGLNIEHFYGHTDEWICSVLVHEQVHAWQYAHGTPSSRGYHNKEWAAKMKMIGLQPTSTGAVGGKETGYHMMHLINPDGPYARAYAKLAKTGFRLEWQSALVGGGNGKKDASKTKFSCRQCGLNAWAKETASIDCHDCGIRMLSEVARG